MKDNREVIFLLDGSVTYHMTRNKDKMTRIESCTCDWVSCGAQKSVDHHMCAPEGWTQLSDLAAAKNYHLCPACRKKLQELFKEGKPKT